MLAVLLVVTANAQVNSGSNGSDGAFNPATDTVINMADHPNGIYQYSSVNISNGVTVTFIPNANNSPVTWLVQSNVVINGTVDLSGAPPNSAQGGWGGPGGWGGGSGGSSGLGAGGGTAGSSSLFPGQSSFGTIGDQNQGQASPGNIYGNIFLIPLVGGSGGGGLPGNPGYGGAGGGGAILIAANGYINLTGAISANGGAGISNPSWLYWAGRGGGGSGGAVRLVASVITGVGGQIVVNGGGGYCGTAYNSFYQSSFPISNNAGNGRIRFDTYQNNFGGSISGAFTFGSQFVITPITGQIPQLTVTSIGGIAVSALPTGELSTPDAVLSSQQNNPIPVVVSCANLPLNTQITVSVKPANGAVVSATGYNNSGTLASSTATISIVIPRGGGLIYATAATGN